MIWRAAGVPESPPLSLKGGDAGISGADAGIVLTGAHGLHRHSFAVPPGPVAAVIPYLSGFASRVRGGGHHRNGVVSPLA